MPRPAALIRGCYRGQEQVKEEVQEEEVVEEQEKKKIHTTPCKGEGKTGGGRTVDREMQGAAGDGTTVLV